MKLARSIAFARHVPPRQIAARFWLEAKRRWSLRAPPRLETLAYPAAAPPQPIFPPRSGMIERLPTGWRFTFVGRSVDTGEAIDWQADPDQLWCMNLHYMEYLEELDRDTGIALIRQWIAANPPWRRGYWRDSWNSYALSLRVVVWMQRLTAWRVDLADPDSRRIVSSLAAQLDFLLRNLERDLGGNHLIKNIKALAWGGAFFTGPFGQKLRDRAIRLLAREIPRQILPDGMHYERSSSYHAQVFADLIETRAALGDQALDPVLARMAQVVTMLTHPDGGPAIFNDAGLTMAYAPDICLTAFARVSRRPIPQRDGAFGFRDAGYFGLHAPGFALIADMGRIGPDSLPAHAHGDIGSIELSIGGERIVVDQGVYEYVAGERRQASRSAHHHNCLAIEGAEPADFYGAFRCGRRPRVGVSQFVGGEGGILLQGHHDGYRRLKGKPVVVRRLEANAEGIVFHDRIDGSHWHEATSRLLLHPDCRIELHGDLAIVHRGEVSIAVKGSAPLHVEPAVWWPDMGVELATRRLCLTLPPGCFEATLEFGAATPLESGIS